MCWRRSQALGENGTTSGLFVSKNACGEKHFCRPSSCVGAPLCQNCSTDFRLIAFGVEFLRSDCKINRLLFLTGASPSVGLSILSSLCVSSIVRANSATGRRSILFFALIFLPAYQVWRGSGDAICTLTYPNQCRLNCIHRHQHTC